MAKAAASKSSRRRRADVVVVGAGAAGLRAARAVKAAGASVVVVEARDRVGGRSESREIHGARFDVGGQWIGPSQRRFWALVRELGIETFPTHHEGKKIIDVDGKLSTYSGFIPAVGLVELADLQQSMWRLDAASNRVSPADPMSARRARELDLRTVEQMKRRIAFTADARKMFDVAARVVFGAEPAELSLLYFLSYLHAGGNFRGLCEIPDGAQQDRFVRGAQELSIRMAEALGDDVVLDSPVRAITQADDGVVVRCEPGVYEAQRVIVAVPPALSSRIEFDPLLPAARAQLLQRYPMGSTAKVLVTYDEAFWRRDGFSGEVVCCDGPLSVVFDNTSHDGAVPCLVAFLCGRDLRRWAHKPADERQRVVVTALARYFGTRATSPTHVEEKIWDEDPWTRGCPVSIVGPGVLSTYSTTLRDPVGRVHWAGTETATEWQGYFEGALQSGERAAAEVIARL